MLDKIGKTTRYTADQPWHPLAVDEAIHHQFNANIRNRIAVEPTLVAPDELASRTNYMVEYDLRTVDGGRHFDPAPTTVRTIYLVKWKDELIVAVRNNEGYDSQDRPKHNSHIVLAKGGFSDYFPYADQVLYQLAKPNGFTLPNEDVKDLVFKAAELMPHVCDAVVMPDVRLRNAIANVGSTSLYSALLTGVSVALMTLSYTEIARYGHDTLIESHDYLEVVVTQSGVRVAESISANGALLYDDIARKVFDDFKEWAAHGQRFDWCYPILDSFQRAFVRRFAHVMGEYEHHWKGVAK